ncbi:hypothetical protein ACQ2H7_004110 [Candidozyma auris]
MPGHDMPGHDMPGHDMPDMCNMNMIFTWDWQNTCVVYKWWHVKTMPGFLATMVALAIFSMLFEYCRAWSAAWRRRQVASVPIAENYTPRNASVRLKSAVMYAGLVGYSFMLMLVFMTYVGWYMIAVVVGAGIGNYLWTADSPETKALICH